MLKHLLIFNWLLNYFVFHTLFGLQVKPTEPETFRKSVPLSFWRWNNMFGRYLTCQWLLIFSIHQCVEHQLLIYHFCPFKSKLWYLAKFNVFNSVDHLCNCRTSVWISALFKVIKKSKTEMPFNAVAERQPTPPYNKILMMIYSSTADFLNQLAFQGTQKE